MVVSCYVLEEMDFRGNEANVPVLLSIEMEAWADLDKIRFFTTAEGGFIYS